MPRRVLDVGDGADAEDMEPDYVRPKCFLNFQKAAGAERENGVLGKIRAGQRLTNQEVAVQRRDTAGAEVGRNQRQTVRYDAGLELRIAELHDFAQIAG